MYQKVRYEYPVPIFDFEFLVHRQLDFFRRHVVAAIVKKQRSFVCNNMGNRMMS